MLTCMWMIVCREVSEEYGREVIRLCELLMGVMSASLGLEERRFREAFGGAECGACLRANYYPRCPQPDLTLGLSAHSDPGVLTVLLADDHVRGLQVRRAGVDGEWVTVQPARHDAFIVNVGDQIQVHILLRRRLRRRPRDVVRACMRAHMHGWW